tara:strand:+ start:599 stop:919 length:321 start_codon:yes stop_codon:yes gene_type:complete
VSCEINNKNKSKEICNIIIHFLPEAIERVIQTYREFTSQELSFEAKEFSQHHTACKAAIAHLEGLMKILKSQSNLADTLIEEELSDLSDVNITQLIEQAKSDLEKK